VGGEAAGVAWVRPADAIAAGQRREIFLMLPTRITLGELDVCGTVDGVLGARRQITPMRPEVTLTSQGPKLHLNGEEQPI
jgi:hypothetical protein